MIDLKKLAEDLKLNDEQRKIIEKYNTQQMYYLHDKIESETNEYVRQCQRNEKKLTFNGVEQIYQFLKLTNFKYQTFTHYFAYHRPKAKKENPDDLTIFVNNQNVKLCEMFISQEGTLDATVYVKVCTEDKFYFAVPIDSLDAKSINKILKLVSEYIWEQRKDKFENLEDEECCTEVSDY